MKWVGVERCSKPISGGPTLAGLPGGVAGDLLRLYPVQSNDEYPIVGIRTPNLDDPVLVCRPLPKKVSIPLTRAVIGGCYSIFYQANQQ